MNHADDIVDFVLTATPTADIANLVTALAAPPVELVKAIVVSAKLREKASLLLTDDRMPDLAIARLARLTLNMFTLCPKQAMQECAYVLAMLHWMHEGSVLTMFSEMCGDDPRILDVREWLIECGFVQMVVNELSEMDHVWKPQGDIDVHLDPCCLKARNLYALIGKFGVSSAFQGKFDPDLVIAELENEFVDAPAFLRNRYWKAVRAMCKAETAEKMVSAFLPKCIKVLEEDNERLYEYQSEAICFLTHLISNVSADVLKDGLEFLVLKIVLKYPNSSILHGVFRKFLQALLDSEMYAERIITLYVPVLITEAKTTQNWVMRATLFHSMKKCCAAVDKNPDRFLPIVSNIPGYQEFVARELKEYREKEEDSYGLDFESHLLMIFAH